ncbi:hypothetical protein AMECASPLE_009850 [Ameca splendens]|uniref:Uncharacterized protein n=1 Tax=Ameca splendens TaxID=208324 RepID=A0ABV0YYA2_9TELE
MWQLPAPSSAPLSTEGRHDTSAPGYTPDQPLSLRPIPGPDPGPVSKESVDEPPSHPVSAREWFGDGLSPLPVPFPVELVAEPLPLLVPVPGELEDKLPPLPIPVCEECEDALPPSAEPQWLHRRSPWLCCRSPGLRHGSLRPRRRFQQFLHHSPGVRRFLHRSPGSQRFLSCSLLSSTVVSSLLSSRCHGLHRWLHRGRHRNRLLRGSSAHLGRPPGKFLRGSFGYRCWPPDSLRLRCGPPRLCLGLRRRPPELRVYMGRPWGRPPELCVCTGGPSGCPPELWFSPGCPSGRPPELCFGFVSGPVPGTFLFLFCFLRVP